MLIQCNELTKIYGSVPALRGMSINLESGKVIGLLGSNGSGKTTLIKILAGILKETSGSAYIDGIPVGPKTKGLVSYLPDKTYLDPSYSVQNVIDLFSDFYIDFDRNKAIEMLLRLKIDPKLKLRTLSKGTHEKVQLILVMSRQAKVYLLDEPIGGVDPAARDYILDTIITNYNPDASVLISTHLIYDIEPILDQVLFISNGEIVLSADVDDVRENQGKSIDQLFREVFRC